MKKSLKIAAVSLVIGVALLFTSVGVINYTHAKRQTVSRFTEIVPAIEDEDFAIGVIRSEDGNDDLVVINSENGNEVIVPIAITEIVTGQDAGEMRGGITVYRNGLGELTGAKLFVPEDAVMREYIK